LGRLRCISKQGLVIFLVAGHFRYANPGKWKSPPLLFRPSFPRTAPNCLGLGHRASAYVRAGGPRDRPFLLGGRTDSCRSRSPPPAVRWIDGFLFALPTFPFRQIDPRRPARPFTRKGPLFFHERPSCSIVSEANKRQCQGGNLDRGANESLSGPLPAEHHPPCF